MNYAMRNLIVAVVLAAVGLVLTMSFVTGQKKKITRGQTYVQTIVAAKDIPAGTPASSLKSEGYVKTEKVVREDLTPQSMSTLDGVSKLKLASNVYAGQQLSAHAFSNTSGLKLTEQFTGTERGMSVAFKPDTAIANLISPGDHIDIVAAGAMTGGSNGDISYVVARDVTVLATPQSLNPDDDASKTAVKATGDPVLYVIKVTDEQAQAIAYAQANAGDHGLQPLLRPSSHGLQTELKPMICPPGCHPVLTTTPRADNKAVTAAKLEVQQFPDSDPQ